MNVYTLVGGSATMTFSDATVQQLQAPLDPARVARRQGGRGSLSYLEGYDVIDTLNAVFGFDGWGMVVDGIVHVAGIVQASVTLTVYADRDIRRGDVGAAIPAGGSNEAMETAIKGAVTDALKRAARTFGNQFGNSLYDKDSELHNPNGGQPRPAPQPARPAATAPRPNGATVPARQAPAPTPAAGGPSDKQINYAYRLGRDAGMDEVQVDALAAELFGSGNGVAGLSRGQASPFIDEMKQRAERGPVDTDQGSDTAYLDEVPF